LRPIFTSTNKLLGFLRLAPRRSSLFSRCPFCNLAFLMSRLSWSAFFSRSGCFFFVFYEPPLLFLFGPCLFMVGIFFCGPRLLHDLDKRLSPPTPPISPRLYESLSPFGCLASFLLCEPDLEPTACRLSPLQQRLPGSRRPLSVPFPTPYVRVFLFQFSFLALLILHLSNSFSYPRLLTSPLPRPLRFFSRFRFRSPVPAVGHPLPIRPLRHFACVFPPGSFPPWPPLSPSRPLYPFICPNEYLYSVAQDFQALPTLCFSFRHSPFAMIGA